LAVVPKPTPLEVVDKAGKAVTVDAAKAPIQSSSLPDAKHLSTLRNNTYDFAAAFLANSGDELALSNLGEDAFLKGNYSWTIKYLEQAKSVQKSLVWMSNYPFLAGAYLLGNNDRAKFESTLDEMMREMNMPSGYLSFPSPRSFTLENLNTVRRAVPDIDRVKIDEVIAQVNKLMGIGTGQTSTAQVCTFSGQAAAGSDAWIKEESCFIPTIDHLDRSYHQGNFSCCGGGAKSPTTAADIPAGLEVITTGSTYWSVTRPVLFSDKFSITTYCGPSENTLNPSGCQVNVVVIAHYKF
jgi:hypothetical protein